MSGDGAGGGSDAPRGLELYQLLRHLTLPIVAVTSSLKGRANGMIANSAQRASLVPSVPRISLYISKTNLTHDFVYHTGVLGVHLLRSDQWHVVRGLGLTSGRDSDKIAAFETRPGPDTGCPLLSDVFAAFECRVVNAMDAGAASFFLADVVSVWAPLDGDVMTSDYFRLNMPADIRRDYEARLAEAQRYQRDIAADVERARSWPGPTASP